MNLIVEKLSELDEFMWIHKKNAEKLGVITGSTIYYEDEVSGISGKTTIKISSDVTESNIMVNQKLVEEWEKKDNWFGTLNIFPEKLQKVKALITPSHTPAPPKPASTSPTSTTSVPTLEKSSTGTYKIAMTNISSAFPNTISASNVPRINSSTLSIPSGPKVKLEKPENVLTLTVNFSSNLNGKIMISRNSANYLGITTEEQPIIFEDTQTGVTGSARSLISDKIQDDTIHMEKITYETSDLQSLKLVVFNPKPQKAPLLKKNKLNLKVEISSLGIGSTVFLSKRNCLSLGVKDGDLIRFEDELTGAWGACRVKKDNTLSNKIIRIEDEIYEATGIGADQVVVKRTTTPVIPLQSLTLGISPLIGENMWNIISIVRNNQDILKKWLTPYIIFKGLKLRWKDANAAIKIISSIPDLKGEILAELKLTSSLQLKPEGLVTFNAVLMVDISSSMLARDMKVKNLAPAIEGIRSAMDNERIRRFLSYFKEGIMVSRRLGATFAALLFLAEKVGRGFGEKVSIIRFADIAEILDFNGPFFDNSSGKHGVLEMAANRIIEKIGEEQGTTTNMSDAIIGAHIIYKQFEKVEGVNTIKPCMFVLLTDGNPTDRRLFKDAVEKYFLNNPNVVFYIVGLGNPDRKLMHEIATRCGGEYFEPEDMGSLLIWYSKRARDLVVKLKGNLSATKLV
ncbi:MAG: hypothetical protein ACFFD2_14005 [Promethearchaeota archaeon]